MQTQVLLLNQIFPARPERLVSVLLMSAKTSFSNHEKNLSVFGRRNIFACLFRGQWRWKQNWCFMWKIMHTPHQSSKKAFCFWAEVFPVPYFSLSLLKVVWWDQLLSWLSFLSGNKQFKEGGKEDHLLCLRLCIWRCRTDAAIICWCQFSDAVAHFSDGLFINSVASFHLLPLEVISSQHYPLGVCSHF